MDIVKGQIIGIDLGIASCGWAIIDQDNDAGHILAMGSRTFDAPEDTDNKHTPKNQQRRTARGMRRVIKRRRQRMNDIRMLFHSMGLINTAGKSALCKKGMDPWRLRAEGLERKLTPEEFAIALGHIAKHRGFKSNRKQQSNAASEDSKMLLAITENQTKMAIYATVGEAFWKDPEYQIRKHNRDGAFDRSVMRDDLERETRVLFSRQRGAGSDCAPTELEEAFIKTAFFQRPLADSEDKVGPCPFESAELRAAKTAPSFEKFRFVSRLTSIRLQGVKTERALTPTEISAACNDFGIQKGMTFKRLRKYLENAENLHFEGLSQDEESKRDVVSRTGNSMAGTAALRKALADNWKDFLNKPEQLDQIAFVLTFREDINSICDGLAAIGLEPHIMNALMSAVKNGIFKDFKGAGHISAKACRNVLPFLMQGLTYDKAMELVGYTHTDRLRPDFKGDSFRSAVKGQISWFNQNVANPVAKKALIEALKQTATLCQTYGLPEEIHVELARDVGKSKEERVEISNGIEKRNKQKEKLTKLFEDEIGYPPRKGSDDLLRFELWQEQNGKCIYTDTYIDPRRITSSDNYVQVDHILPWSRSGDDSFTNKTLCLTSANQDKKGQTPYEWFGKDEELWSVYVERVETNPNMKGRKRRNYLLKDTRIVTEKFRPRNLNDTRYATRLLCDALKSWYPEDGHVHVCARPGPLTDRLRRGWGVQDFKKIQEPDGEKRKSDDRHHALDALIVAATTQRALNQLTHAFQEQERIGGTRDFSHLPQPWPHFIEELKAQYADIFVSRAERHRARGKGHAATIRQVEELDDGQTVVYERCSVETLNESDLEKIKDPERNAALISNIREWIAAGKIKGTYPKSPKGDDIRKVRIATNKKPDVLVQGGAADRGDMVRVDVFRKQNKRGKWEYSLVPIYPHQVMDREDYPTPPNKMVKAHIDETEWPPLTSTHEFLWSIYPLSYLEIEKSDGTHIEGYYRGMNRSTAAIAISPHNNKQDGCSGIGVKTLKTFRKYTVDRLGRKHLVTKEVRTWHGEACT